MSFYLSKGGQKFGPFTQEQLDELKRKGEYASYQYFWDDATPGWQAVASPPDAPSAPVSAMDTPLPNEKPASSRGRSKDLHPEFPRRPSPERVAEDLTPTPMKRYYETPLRAVCLDHHRALSATLAKVSDEGCELVADGHASSPAFTKDAKVVLNLFDEKSGKSVNVPVKVDQVTRRDGNWSYRVRWADCPDLVVLTAA